MEDKSISLIDVLLLLLYLGLIVYVIGLVIYIFLLHRKKVSKSRIIISSVVQLFLTVVLSMIFWRFWFLETDTIFGIVFLPALCAEIISILLLYSTITKHKKKL